MTVCGVAAHRKYSCEYENLNTKGRSLIKLTDQGDNLPILNHNMSWV